MNILHVILTREFAGSERYAAQLAGMQAAAGHGVRLVIKGGDEAYVRRMVAEAAPAPVVTIPGWLPSLFDAFAIRGVINGFAPDVVHSHLGRAAKRAGKAARGAAKRREVEGLRPLRHVATLHLDWRKDYALCDGVICIAEWQRGSIPASYTGAVAVVWNWVGGQSHEVRVPSVARRVGTGSTTDTAWNSDLRTLTFLSVGRLVPNKGMDVLVKAFRKAFPTGKEKAGLTIVGEGPERASLEKLAAGDARIRLVGFADPAPYYASHPVYVSAARYEPFGLTILEAMQAGCRLVCTRTQGPEEFLKGYKVEWAKPGDVATLAKALQAAAKGKGRVPWDMAPFAPKAALAKVLGFYNSMLERKA